MVAPATVPGHEYSQAQNNFWVTCSRGLLNINSPVYHGKLIIRCARSPTPERTHQVRSDGAGLVQQLGRIPVNCLGIPEVESHPLRRGQRTGPAANAAARQVFLSFPGDDVLVTVGAIVEVAARRRQKLHRLEYIIVCGILLQMQ
jgi:hypothetical protein